MCIWWTHMFHMPAMTELPLQELRVAPHMGGGGVTSLECGSNSSKLQRQPKKGTTGPVIWSTASIWQVIVLLMQSLSLSTRERTFRKRLRGLGLHGQPWSSTRCTLSDEAALELHLRNGSPSLMNRAALSLSFWSSGLLLSPPSTALSLQTALPPALLLLVLLPDLCPRGAPGSDVPSSAQMRLPYSRRL